MMAVLPHPDVPPIRIGDVTISIFDILVALAVLVGVLVAERRAAREGLDRRVILDMSLWAVIPGFIGSHLVSILFYFPERLSEQGPIVLLDLFAGMSSVGGFIGGTLGVVFFFRRRGIPVARYTNAVVYGFTFAWVFGRLGCTIAFDHPGVTTDFVLAMPYPGSSSVPAGIRHNLGFYELLWAIALATLFFATRKRPRFAGWHLSVFLLTYTPLRFGLDFLREKDLRYGGLTVAQMATAGLFVVGVIVAVRLKRRGEILVPDGEPHRPDADVEAPSPEPEPQRPSQSRS